ncbi:MAG TPA: hypothetical protein VJ302_37505 [Blastocatellia bacterium]|nr:hypothetical protein [Blastocatellia bacterium]
MLKLTPKGWLSWDFLIGEHDLTLGEVDFSWMGEKGSITLGQSTFKAYRRGMLGKEYALESNGVILARAEKTSLFRRSYEVRFGNRSYTLQAESMFHRAFVLMDGQTEVGWISPDGSITRCTSAALPEHFPLPVKVFIIWLVLLTWKQAAAAAAVAGG